MLHSAAGCRGGRRTLCTCGAELKFNGAVNKPDLRERPVPVREGTAAAAALRSMARLLAISVAVCLLSFRQCNTKALSRSQKNSTLVAPVLSGENSEFYSHEGRLCKKCPAGFHLSHPCETTGTESSCEPCSSDTYTPVSNNLHVCFFCKTCRPIDQVTVKLCSNTSDAECACKEGTFCSPHQACETCYKCKSRCPDGEEMEQPCTPQSDIRCAPVPTSAPAPSGKNWDSKTLALLSVFIILSVVCTVFLCACRRNLQRCFRDHTRTRASSVGAKTFLWLQTKFTHGQPESEDNEWNAQVDLAPQSLPGSSATRQPDETSPLQETADNTNRRAACFPREEERRKLVPAEGEDPEKALRQSFILIGKEVPLNKWHSYMIVLGLTDNEIEIAKVNARDDVAEQHFQMLQTWREKNGLKASLDTLLKTLCDPTVDLKGVELKIREALISRHLYVYEE